MPLSTLVLLLANAVLLGANFALWLANRSLRTHLEELRATIQRKTPRKAPEPPQGLPHL